VEWWQHATTSSPHPRRPRSAPGYAAPSPGGHDPPARGGAAGGRAGAWGQAEGAGPAPNGPPQQMAPVAGARHPVLRAVGRRLMAWVLPHLVPARAAEMPSRVWGKGRASRRCR